MGMTVFLQKPPHTGGFSEEVLSPCEVFVLRIPSSVDFHRHARRVEQRHRSVFRRREGQVIAAAPRDCGRVDILTTFAASRELGRRILQTDQLHSHASTVVNFPAEESVSEY